MSQRFRPHGEYSYGVEGQVVISDINGPWNVELVEQWAQQLHARMPPVAANGPHVGIAIIHGSILCPPDALQLMGKSVRFSARHFQCIGNIIVAAAGVEGRDLMLPSLAGMYQGLAPFRMVEDLAAAMQWAHELLAAAGADPARE